MKAPRKNPSTIVRIVAANQPARPSAASDDPELEPAHPSAPAAGPSAPPSSSLQLPSVVPGIVDVIHPKKSEWSMGIDRSKNVVHYLDFTLTPSDRATGRARPPRDWFALLVRGVKPKTVLLRYLPPGGALQEELILGVNQYPTAKTETYIHGAPLKAFFERHGTKGGDWLRFWYEGVDVVSGTGPRAKRRPILRLTIIDAADNPVAPALLARCAKE